MFNGWYFLFLISSIAIFIALYFMLKNRTAKTQKIVLFSILLVGLLLHFLKAFIPPYSTDINRWYRDSWFINICAADIFLFPFIFLSKSDKLKDYMFYIGLLSGLISIIYPMEAMAKVNQSAEILDIIRFYFHHNMLWYVPLLMVLFNLHKLNYHRVIYVPVIFLGVLLFVMINQVLQSELGFVAMRGDQDDFFNITYKNSSLIWGPDSSAISSFLKAFCPKIFKTVPVGEFAGQEKYLPWFWLIVPAFVLLIPVCFLISMIFDWKHLLLDFKHLANKLNEKQPCTNINTTNENMNIVVDEIDTTNTQSKLSTEEKSSTLQDKIIQQIKTKKNKNKTKK